MRLLASLCAVLHVAVSARATQVTTNTQTALAAALVGGGTVTFAGDGTITLTNTLTISTNVTLDGSGYNVAISGGNAVRIFIVKSNITFSLKNLTLVNGNYTATNSTNLACGGALYNAGTTKAVDCIFSNNIVIGIGPTNGGYDAFGGAICNQGGTLAVTNSTFLTNCAFGGEAGARGGNSYGGAIASTGGVISLSGATFGANQSVGGGDPPAENGTVLGNASGGALFVTNASATVNTCAFYANQAIALTATNRLYAYPGSGYGGAICQVGGTVTLLQCMLVSNACTGGTIESYNDNSGSGYGGAVFTSGTFNATNCTFSANSAIGGTDGTPPGDGDGGAIFNAGVSIVAGSSLSGNYVVSGFAGESGIGGTGPSGAANGGGIYNSNTLVLIGTTLTGNMAMGTSASENIGFGPYIAGNGSGGGIFNIGTLHATNNTFSGNSATGGSNSRGGPGPGTGGDGRGGAIFNRGGTATLAFQTIFSNVALGGTAPGGSTGASLGGGIFATNGTLLLYNSIVASNASGGDFYVLSNAVTDGGNNLSSDASFAFAAPGSHNNVNPLLGPLANNGGPTLTMLPLIGSPAIDAASSASTTPIDQRGLARPYGSASDIGAVEYYPGFSIQGIVQHAPANQPVTVTAGIFSTTTDPFGNYTLGGIPAGSYSVTPAASGFVFVPPSQSVGLASDLNNVNFAAYQMNALTLVSYFNPILQIAYAGTNGQRAVVQSSATLSNWAPFLTNVVGASGIFEFQVTNTPGQPIQFYRAQSP